MSWDSRDQRLSRRAVLALFGVGLAVGRRSARARGVRTPEQMPPPERGNWEPLWIAAGTETSTALNAAQWIWFPEGNPAADAPVGRRYFRRTFALPSGRSVVSARAAIKADNEYVLLVNGIRVGTDDDFRRTGHYDVTAALHGAAVTITIEAVNGGTAPNPAGLIAALRIEFVQGQPLDIITDAHWQTAQTAAPGWETAEFDASGWVPALSLGTYGIAPWGVTDSREVDVYAAFRGTLTLPEETDVVLDVFGAHWFQVTVDGHFLTEGPYRFPADHPEYEVCTVKLARGVHVIAATVRCEGVATRLLRGDVIHPFFLCRAHADGKPIPIAWKATRLSGYLAAGQRVNPQFGWIEWLDTRRNPLGWQETAFNDSLWPSPALVDMPKDWSPDHSRPVGIAAVQHLPVVPHQIGEGKLTGPFDRGDRPTWKTDTDLPWYARDLAPQNGAEGVWRRYDLGQVRLGVPTFTLDVPAGAIIEIAYSEELREGRVTPFIPLSAGLSRNLDHFVARGGRQTFAPIAPKGGRYLEIHVAADPSDVHFHAVSYRHRTYYGEPVGAFDSGDRRLNAVWALGIATLRACAEDAVIDNPTRERGQWTGDALPSLHVASAGFNDLRIIRRALEQSAYCARADGLVAGLCPGGDSHLSTYAAQWFSAVLEYYDLTGDQTILPGLYPYAVRNRAAFAAALGPDGVKDTLGWAFIDWGYPGTPDTEADVALNLHVLSGIRSMQRWDRLLGRDSTPSDTLEAQVRAAVSAWLAPRIAARWPEIGYHRTALALRCGLIPDPQKPSAVAFLKRHIMSCYPNDPNAPRLANPDVRSAQLITPYFAYYAFPELVAMGETDFVLEQYRRCWGWALDQGLTTQPEVFDLSWSHCHVWAASPTAQMTRYLLGLQPRFDLGPNHFDLTLQPGSLPHASGAVPFPNGKGAVAVHWERTDVQTIRMAIRTPHPIHLHHPGDATAFLDIDPHVSITLTWDGNRWRVKA